MSLYSTPQIKLLFQKLEHLQARQETASDNMARSGVAGEKTKQVEDFKKSLRRNRPSKSIKTTNSRHLSGNIKETKFKTSIAKKQGEPSITGNSISAEEQLLALNETGTEFFRMRQVNKNIITRVRLIAGIGSGK